MDFNGTSVRGVAALCKRYELAQDLFDARAHWDSTLNYHENMAKLEEEVKKIAPPLAELPCPSEKDLAEEAKHLERENFRRVQEEKQAYLDQLFKDAAQREGEAAELLNEIAQFNPHSERLTLSTLLAINQGMNVINLSPAGYGKSRATKELLDMLEVPYTEMSGHLAPTDFFEQLKQARGIVLIDESATLLRNNEILNLLLAALWTKKIAWRDDEATVEATIIFNTNSLPNTPFMAALKDRCQFNQLRLDTDKIRDKLLSDFDYQPKKEIWARVKNNAFIRLELEPSEVLKVKELLKITSPKSVRDKKKLLACARFCKAMFGTIDYVKLFVEIDATTEILASALSNSQKVKAIAEADGVSARTAQRWVKGD